MECAVHVKVVAKTNNVPIEKMGSFVLLSVTRTYPVVRTSKNKVLLLTRKDHKSAFTKTTMHYSLALPLHVIKYSSLA